MFVVFDLDGTLALIEHRRHFVRDGNKQWKEFYAACHKDIPNRPIIEVLRALVSAGHRVEIWSGRSSEVIKMTSEWLARQNLENVAFRCRREGDYTPDDELKQRWLDECGLPKPDLIFDDRDAVVDMWRMNGIVCAQVAPGDF